MNNGFQNERDFVELFNNKYLYELDDRSIVFLKELFGEVIDDEEIIISKIKSLLVLGLEIDLYLRLCHLMNIKIINIII